MKKRTHQTHDIRTRHVNNQRRKRRNRKIIRSTLLLFVLTGAIFALVFMTPIFNVTSISVSGNKKVDNQSIINASGIIAGQNIFKISYKKATEKITTIPYVEKISIKRRFLPKPKIDIIVSEAKMAMQIAYGGKYAGIDINSKALEISDGVFEGVPEIRNINITKFDLAKKITVDESDKFDIIRTYMREFVENELVGNVNYIYVDDVNNINMKFEDRLDVVISDSPNYKRNVAMLKEVLLTQLAKDSKGTVKIMTDGKVTYLP